jgi:hypothetical protein
MQSLQVLALALTLGLAMPMMCLAQEEEEDTTDLPPEQQEAFESLAQSYNTLMNTLELGEEGDEDARRHGEVSLRNLQEAIRQADAAGVPDSAGFTIGGFPRITVAGVKAKVAEMAAATQQNVAAVRAADAAKRAPFAAALSGDKLRIFDEVFGVSLVCSGRNGRTLYTPQEYAASPIWAKTTYNGNVYPPTWTVTVYRFDGMRLVGTERKTGTGSGAPSSAYQ